MDESIADRAKREREAREKWKKQYNENQKKIEEEKALELQLREERMLEVQKEWDAYKESDEYKHNLKEKLISRNDVWEKHYQTIRQDGISLIKEYRLKYKMNTEPIWKVYQTVINKEGIGLCNKFPGWVGRQISTENMIPLNQIKTMENPKCIRFYGDHCTVTDDFNAMHMFGPRLEICYNNTFNRIDDVVWSYENSSNDKHYIDFHYHTHIEDPTVQLQGFLLCSRHDDIDKDGMKIINQPSLVKNAEIFYIEKFLSKEEADELFDTLYDMNKFVHTQMYFYNQETKEIESRSNHRKSYWLGDHAQATGYTDQTIIDNDTNEKISIPTDYVKPYEFPPILWSLKRKIEKAYGVEFNGCLVGLFDNPEQKIGYHSDSSKSMGEDPYIGSVSLGAPRKFNIKPNKNQNTEQKGTEQNPVSVKLGHGDLVVMRKNANRKYLHAVMKDPACNEDNVRINLTFRLYNYHPDEMKFNASGF